MFVFLALTQGCEPKSSSFSPTQNGFGVVAQWVGIDSGPAAQFYYKGTNESPVLVWPMIGTHQYPILYTNDIAFLLADKPNEQGIGGGALIVVQGVGPAMDISQDVLKIVAEENHVDFKKALRVCKPMRLIQTNQNMKLVYLADPAVDRSVPNLEGQITWEQVFDIMHDVQKTGKTNKVVNTDLLYLQKDYNSK